MSSFEPRTVLLVEDNADDEALTIRGLRLTGLAVLVDVARDGDHAMELLRRNLPPDLLLCDLKLPKRNGTEVLAGLRQDPRTLAVPAVVFSSSDDERDIAACYDLGANSYVRKPVDSEKYIEVVKDVARYWLEGQEDRRAPFCQFRLAHQALGPSDGHM